MQSVRDWMYNHPNLSMWFVLGVGMVVILLFSAQDVDLTGSQRFWLVVITFLVAGACTWIISWGDDEDDTVEDKRM